MRGVRLLALACAAGLLTACAGTQAGEGGGLHLRVCIASEPQTIDPALSSSVDGAILTQHVFEGLTRWADSGEALDGRVNAAQVAPGQAASWEKTPGADGGVTYTFHLREDIFWSDGRPVTAGDFVYAWRRLADPATGADYCYMIDMVRGYGPVNAGEADPSALGVSAPDARTFVAELTYDCPYFLEICAFPATLPVRRDMIEAHGDAWTFSPETYIGNGPYRLRRWNHNASIELVRSERYYGAGSPGPAAITFQLMDNANAMLAAYNSGELHFLNSVPVDEFASLLAGGELSIADYTGTYYVCYNVQASPFDDWRVRKAFTLAIDARYLTERVTQGGELPAAAFVPPGVRDGLGGDFRAAGGSYWDASGEAYAANLAEANRLLDEAGYADRSSFPAVTYLYNTDDKHGAIAEALQHMWSEGLGVAVRLRNQDWSVFLENRKQGDYQVARNAWIADCSDPITFLDLWVSGSGNNDAQYADPDYDAAVARAKSTSDPAARMAALHEAEDILVGRDWVVGPVYFYTQPYLLRPGVEGVYYTPLGYFFFRNAVLR